MIKSFAISLAVLLMPAISQAEMFSNNSETSSHDARCTKNERDAGTCGRDAETRYKRNIQHQDVRVEQDIDIEKRGYDRQDRYDRRYDDRRYPDPRYDDRRDRRGYDDRYDRGGRYDDHRGHGHGQRFDPNWKEKHDIRTEDAFERQRRKDQEYYDKY